MDIKVRVQASVNPTEDEQKVRRALENIFPSGRIERMASEADSVSLKLEGNGIDFLSTLRNLIKQERIRSAARSIILSRTHGDRIRVYLNKQAAFVGRVSFCEPVGESPLGPISIEVRTEDPQAVVDFLTSRPRDDFYRRPRGRT